MNKFGDNLKHARKVLEMNQQALGDAVGVGQTTIANYEKGIRFPTGELLKKIAEVLNVSIDQLMSHQTLGRHLVDDDFDMDAYRQTFLNCLLRGEEQAAMVMVWDLNPNEDNLLMIYEELLTKTLYRIGDLWAEGNLTVATEHYASHVINKIVSMISTIPAERPKYGKKALCMSIGAEAHTIGIHMVSDFMNYAGVQSFYIGTNVPTDSLVEMLIRKRIDLLAVSLTMDSNKEILVELAKSLKDNDQLKNLKILIGGQGAVGGQGWRILPDVDGFAADFGEIKRWLYDNGFILTNAE